MTEHTEKELNIDYFIFDDNNQERITEMFWTDL